MGMNDAAEQLAVAIEEVGKLERELALIQNPGAMLPDDHDADWWRRAAAFWARQDERHEAERDAARAVILQATVDINDLSRPWHRVFQRTLATLRTSPLDTLDAVKAAAWDFCLDEIEKHELNTDQARSGNPYRKENPNE